MRVKTELPKLLAIAVSLSPVFAQSQSNWDRFDNGSPAAQSGYPETAQNGNEAPPPPPGNYPPDNGGMAQQGPPPPPGGPNSDGNAGGYPRFPQNNQYAQQNFDAPPPPTLTIPAGKYLTVRMTTPLSSDRNHAGDYFSATLAEPVVVDGYVVAARGQVVNGRVVDAQKAGRMSGQSLLRVELTELNAVDGQQLPFHSQMVAREGGTSVGRDVAGVAGTTALGAAAGSMAWNAGRGAAIGAGAGAAVGLLGVLVTRGRPTIIYPEALLTFRIEQPLLISTTRSPNAFTTVAREDYAQPMHGSPRMGMNGQGYGQPYYGYAGAAPYPYYYGGPYWNSGFFFYGGPRYYRGWGRGYYRRW